MLYLSNFVGDTSHFWWGGTHCRIQIFLNLHMSTQMAFGERQRPSFKAYCQCHFSIRCSQIPPKMDPSLSVDLWGHSVPRFASDVVPHSSLRPLLNCGPPEGGAALAGPCVACYTCVESTLQMHSWVGKTGIERVREKAGGLWKPLTFQELEMHSRGHPGQGAGLVSGCVEAAFLVEGMAVKPREGILRWMSSQNPQCSWAQRSSDEEGNSVGSLTNI